MRLFEHLGNQGGMIMLKTVEAPELDQQTNLGLFKQAQKHAAKVISYIFKQDQMALNEYDYACQVKRSLGYIQLVRLKH